MLSTRPFYTSGKKSKSARISMNTTVLLDSNSKEKVSMSADKSMVLADGQQIRKIAKKSHQSQDKTHFELIESEALPMLRGTRVDWRYQKSASVRSDGRGDGRENVAPGA